MQSYGKNVRLEFGVTTVHCDSIHCIVFLIIVDKTDENASMIITDYCVLQPTHYYSKHWLMLANQILLGK